MRRIAALAIIVMGFSASAPSPSHAAPVFKLPFPCGETYWGVTYDGHYDGDEFRYEPHDNDYPIDFNRDNNGDAHQPVVASQAGTVVRVDRPGEPNNQGVVELDHGGGWVTTYGHMENIPAHIDDDEWIEMGEIVGHVGNVAAPQGYHLHYAQMLNRVPQPPKFDGVAVTVSHSYSDTYFTSTNCASGRANDIVFVEGKYDTDQIVFHRFKTFGGEWQEPTFRFWANNPVGIDDHVVAGDFDNDGATDDIAVAWERNNSTLVRRYANGGNTEIGTHISAGPPLSRMEGRMVSVNLDGE